MIVIISITLACVIALLLLLFAGVVYQRIGGWSDRKRMLAPGRLVKTGAGRELYLLEKGHGDVTVVFEAGFAASSLNWISIQSAIAEHARTVSYDRCGLGWSSAATSPRTPAHIVEELRSMLREAGIEPPFVLVGHSFGGLVMRRFALEHPEEISGVVLIDPMRTEEWPPLNEAASPDLVRAREMTRHAARIAKFGVARLAARSLLCRSGKIARWLERLGGEQGAYLVGRVTGEVGKLPIAVHPAIAAHWSDPGFYRGLIAHLDAVTATVNEMHDAAPISKPVVVLTPQSAVPLSADDLRRIAADGRQIIAERSTHWVHLDEPQLVIDTIFEMVRLEDPLIEKVDGVTSSTNA